ncbi:MAG: ferric reductase-like transmembrane domain-containing protein [Anaerolineales bacterium]
MSTQLPVNQVRKYSTWQVIISILATFLVIGSILVVAVVAMTPAGQSLGTFLRWLFALDSVQVWWYVTRASGILAYLLLWFSTVLGLAVTSKYLDGMLDRLFTYDFHEFISLLAVAFTLVHVIVLTFDLYMPYSLAQILVPFISPYRPFWVGVGVIAFYIMVLVTVTFYLRNRIGTRAFRSIHILSLLGYIGVTLHGYFSGTDTALPSMRILYEVSGLAVLFLTVYWLVLLGLRKGEKRRQAELLAANAARKLRAPAR